MKYSRSSSNGDSLLSPSIKTPIRSRSPRRLGPRLPVLAPPLLVLIVLSFFAYTFKRAGIISSPLPVTLEDDTHDPKPSLTIEERVRRILSENPLIDGHNDLMILARSRFGDHIYNNTFEQLFEQGGLPGHVDLPRLREGLVGGAFWSAYIPCPADSWDFSDENYAEVVRATSEQLDLYQRLSAKYPHFFTPPVDSTTALNDFRDKGRLISPLAIEGLHQIGNSISTLRLYHSLGVRYATLTWNCHNAFADAAVVPDRETGRMVRSRPHWGGVSKKGRDVIYEMNRLGMIVDLAHASLDTMRDVLIGSGKREDDWKGSAAPPIFSHSSTYALCPHPRNVPDDILQLVKQRGSLVMINFSGDFISCTASDDSSGLPDTFTENVTLNQVVAHIKHVGELIGYDYVGIGSDFDGISMPPKGLEDVSKFPDLVAELLRQNIAEEDVIKIIGGNLLRVWREVDAISGMMKKVTEPLEDDIKPVR